MVQRVKHMLAISSTTLDMVLELRIIKMEDQNTSEAGWMEIQKVKNSSKHICRIIAKIPWNQTYY